MCKWNSTNCDPFIAPPEPNFIILNTCLKFSMKLVKIKCSKKYSVIKNANHRENYGTIVVNSFSIKEKLIPMKMKMLFF